MNVGNSLVNVGNSLVRSQDMLALECQFQFFLAREFSLVTWVHSWRDSFYFSVKLQARIVSHLLQNVFFSDKLLVCHLKLASLFAVRFLISEGD